MSRALSRLRAFAPLVLAVACAMVGPPAVGQGDSGALLFLGEKDLPPYEFLRDGAPAGANVDLVRALERRLGRPVEVRLMDWSEAQAQVLAGAAHGLTMRGRTPEREASFLFTAPTVPVNFALFVRSDEAAGFQRAPMAGRRVAVTRGGLARAQLLHAQPGVVPVDMDSILEGITLLLRRDVDAIAAQEWSVYFQLAELGLTSITGLPPYHSRTANIAVRRGDTELVAALDAALRDVKASGELDRILDRWSSTRMRTVSEFAISTAATVAVASLVVLAVLVTAVTLLRRRSKLLAAEVQERREVEARLREAKTQLERADRNKDRFLATLAHELRNPLAPISHAAAVLERAPHDVARVRRAQEMIARQVAHLGRLVDELTDIGRISNGQTDLQLQPVRLQELLDEAVETVSPRMEAKQQELTTRLPESAVMVNADRVRMRQVIVNLLTNACRYTPEGGSVTVMLQVDGDQAVVTVRDTGIGLAPGTKDHLFELFFRDSEAAHSVPEGLGLGLWLCQRLVALHGGSLTAESEGSGQGSTFVVCLPLGETRA